MPSRGVLDNREPPSERPGRPTSTETRMPCFCSHSVASRSSWSVHSPFGTPPHGVGLSATVPKANSLKASTPPHSGACRTAAMALARTARMRPSVLFMGFERNKSFLQDELAKSTWALSSSTGSGPTIARWSSMPFPFGHIPFKEAHEGASAAQVRSEFGTGGANDVLRTGVRIVSDHDLVALPGGPVQVRDDALHIEATPVRSDGLAHHSAPVVHAGQTKREKPGSCRRTVMGQAPEGERLDSPSVTTTGCSRRGEGPGRCPVRCTAYWTGPAG
jgi:hypothetical protein